jgi:uncharacterized membrane protein YeaQ/YmgE (transglycosylase-associated protein family)
MYATINLSKLIVWLVVGALAGTLASRLMTFSKQGFGWWTNIVIGMIGALVGGFLFWVFGINFSLDINITLEDLVSAFVGSILCIVVWWLIHKIVTRKHAPARS